MRVVVGNVFSASKDTQLNSAFQTIASRVAMLRISNDGGRPGDASAPVLTTAASPRSSSHPGARSALVLIMGLMDIAYNAYAQAAI